MYEFGNSKVQSNGFYVLGTVNKTVWTEIVLVWEQMFTVKMGLLTAFTE